MLLNLGHARFETWPSRGKLWEAAPTLIASIDYAPWHSKAFERQGTEGCQRGDPAICAPEGRDRTHGGLTVHIAEAGGALKVRGHLGDLSDRAHDREAHSGRGGVQAT